MKTAEPWNNFNSLMATARYQYAQGYEAPSWYYLLLATEVNWRPEPTPKQVQQRKLWVQRGHLERTLSNLRELLRNSAYKDSNPEKIYSAVDEVKKLIADNREQMRNLR